MQAKRIQVNENNVGVNGAVEVVLAVPSDPREEVNFHNIWIGATAEPQNAEANSQGTWVLWVRRQGAPSVIFTDTIVNAENSNTVIIACGVYSAANESPWTLPPTQIKTSRTLQAGDLLALTLMTTGITAGLSSNRVMLCAHTTRK